MTIKYTCTFPIMGPTLKSAPLKSYVNTNPPPQVVRKFGGLEFQSSVNRGAHCPFLSEILMVNICQPSYPGYCNLLLTHFCYGHMFALRLCQR